VPAWLSDKPDPPCVKRLKTESIFEGDIPAPVSLNLSVMQSLFFSIPMVIFPPAFVNLKEFEKKLDITRENFLTSI